MLLLLISLFSKINQHQQPDVQPPKWVRSYLNTRPCYSDAQYDRLASAIVISGKTPTLMLAGKELRYVTQIPAGYPRAVRDVPIDGFKTPLLPPTTPGDYEVLLEKIDLNNLPGFYNCLTTQPTQVYQDNAGQDYFVIFWLKATSLPNCKETGEAMGGTLFEDLDFNDVESLFSMVKFEGQKGFQIDMTHQSDVAHPKSIIIATIKQKMIGQSATSQALCALILNDLGDEMSAITNLNQIAQSSIEDPDIWNRPLILEIIDQHLRGPSSSDQEVHQLIGNKEWESNVLKEATQSPCPNIKLMLFKHIMEFESSPANFANMQTIIKQLGSDNYILNFSDWMEALWGLFPKISPITIERNLLAKQDDKGPNGTGEIIMTREMLSRSDPHWQDPAFRQKCLDVWSRAISRLQASDVQAQK